MIQEFPLLLRSEPIAAATSAVIITCTRRFSRVTFDATSQVILLVTRLRWLLPPGKLCLEEEEKQLCCREQMYSDISQPIVAGTGRAECIGEGS